MIRWSRLMLVQPHSFPIGKTAVFLTTVAVGSWAVLAGPIGSIYGGGADVHEAVRLGVMLAWVSAVVGVLPVSVTGPSGVMPTVWGYFIGMGLRGSVCFGALVWARWHGRWPVEPLSVAVAATYVPLLFVEAAIVGRYLWTKDFRFRDDQRSLGVASKPMEVTA